VTGIGDKKSAAFASHMHCGSWKADTSLMAFTQTTRTSTELFISCVNKLASRGPGNSCYCTLKKGITDTYTHTHTHRS